MRVSSSVRPTGRQHGCNFIAAMPTNLYGPGDNYDPQNSYVLPALLRKFHAAIQQGAPTVEVWGTGTPRREFLHVDDLADACLFLMQHYNEMEPINIGTGEDISVGDLARLIQRITHFRGKGSLQRPHARRHPAQSTGYKPFDKYGLAGYHAPH